MNKLLKNFVVLALVFTFLAPSTFPIVSAYKAVTPAPNKSINDLPDILVKIDKLVEYVYILLFIVAVAFLISAAFSYLTSGGDQGKVKKASAQLIYAIVAIVVGALAYSITTIIAKFLG